MPEYKNGHWAPEPNPPYEELALCQEVYQIWPTGEIFTNYEKYCERLFMYNQPDWTCTFTGKSGLTFNEALASEDRMRKSLDAFPEAWKGPLLAFVQHATASLEQISMQFMDFVRVNFIPGEDVKIDFDGKRMNAKIISSSQVPNSTELSYRLEIFQDEACTELVGEANVIGSASFTRERLNLNRAMIKRYVRSVALRRSTNTPWFIPDELAIKYGIATELPDGITPDMKPPVGPDGQFIRQAIKQGLLPGGSKSSDQMAIDEFFGSSSSVGSAASNQPHPAEALPQFNFPCDDAQVPIELIDADLPFPVLKPVNELITESSLLTRSVSIWSFLQTFSTLLQLSPFAYDDWEESITCSDPSIVKNPLLEETMLALLSTLMKDRRNLTKAAFAERIKTLVLSFAIETAPEGADGDAVMTDAPQEKSGSDDGKPEIIIFSDEDDSSEPIVKQRPRQPSKSSGALLPSIDLRRHRWYETKAMDQWHFVLASFFLEAIEMMREEIDPDESSSDTSGSENESGSASETEIESAHEMDEDYVDEGDESGEEGKQPENGAEEEDSAAVEIENKAEAAKAAKAAKVAMISSFIDAFDLIVDEYTREGSRHLFTRFTSLSLHAKFSLIEFLMHANYDREAFKTHVEDCLEQQTELRRVRREVEGQLAEVTAQLEEIEGKAAVLKAENAEISDQLAADDEIALSDGESETEDEAEAETEAEGESESAITKNEPREPLTEKEREELAQKRAANKKEINALNASLRRIRPEHAGLQRRFEAVSRDARKSASFRTFPLGEDRLGRIYWWFGEFVHPMPRILVASSTGEWLGAVDTPEGLDQLLAWLNALGIREAKLKCALLESEQDLRQFLEPRSLPIDQDAEDEEAAADEDEEEEIVVRKRGRGRPKGSFGGRKLASRERPFQRYKNTM